LSRSALTYSCRAHQIHKPRGQVRASDEGRRDRSGCSCRQSAKRDCCRLSAWRDAEDTYVYWLRDFVRFHARRHPHEIGPADVEARLTMLATE